MPYKTVQEAEKRNPGLAKYSAKAKRGWLSAFNGCMDKGHSESRCFGSAYSVANKVDGKKAAGRTAATIPGTLYHVTLSAGKILSQGFKLGQPQVFGDAGAKAGISFTANKSEAEDYANGLRTMIRWSQGKLDFDDLYEIGSQFGLSRGAVDEAIQTGQAVSKVYWKPEVLEYMPEDKQRWIREALLAFTPLSNGRFPWVLARPDVVKRLSSAGPSDVQIIEVKLDEEPEAEYKSGEKEWRVYGVDVLNRAKMRVASTVLEIAERVIRASLALTPADKRVIGRFLGKAADESKHLYTDGKTLDGLWLGGNGLAAWESDVVFVGKNRPHGKSDATVIRFLERQGRSLVQQQPVVRFVDEMVGSHHGQQDMVLSAIDVNSGSTVGYVEYAEFDGEAHVAYIFVDKRYRRLGFGTELMQRLYKEYGKTRVHWGMMTPEGVFLKKRMDLRFGGVRVAMKSAPGIEDSIAVLERMFGVEWDGERFHALIFPNAAPSRCEIDEVPSGLTASRSRTAVAREILQIARIFCGR